MTSIALFLLIGMSLKAGALYWVCFGLYSLSCVLNSIIKLGDKVNKRLDELHD